MKEKIYYKVFTKELKSLGLRKNPNILTFTPQEWYFLEKDQIREGVSDFGGIWVCRSIGGANTLTNYMLNKHNIETRAFIVLIDNILYSNSYRLKTNGIYLKEEINLLDTAKNKILYKQ